MDCFHLCVFRRESRKHELVKRVFMLNPSKCHRLIFSIESFHLTYEFLQGEVRQSQTSTLPELQQGSSFQLQLFERKQEETLSFIQRTVHEQMRNLHLELISQNHMLQVHFLSLYYLVLWLYSICNLDLETYTDGNV